MASRIDDLTAELLSLPNRDRAELAQVLLRSLDSEEACEEAWDDEAHRRFDEIRNGQVTPISSDEVFQEARARLR
ncbi:MAG TPA: addiction module protein [Thermoanaerobaculia bacterium]|nr:addiction module protein [Thermoanaerobaculia bacterium]